MQVLIVIDKLAVGGAELVMMTLCREMVKQGHEVVLLTLDERHSMSPPEGVVHHTIGHRYGGPIDKLLRHKRHAAVVDAFLQEHGLVKPDLVLVNLYRSHQVVSHSRYLGEKAWKVIHNNIAGLYLNSRSVLKRWIKRRALKKLYSRRLVTVSEALKDQVVNLLGTDPVQVVPIYNAVDANDIRDKMCETIEFGDGEFFVHVGRFNVRQKRHDRLLRLFAASGVRHSLVVIGDGPDRDRINAFSEQYGIADRVHLIGRQENPFKYMGRSRGLLLTSDYEGLSSVIIEAMVCGVPVVSFASPFGPSELLVGEHRANLIPMGEDEAFVQRLKYYDTHLERLDYDVLERFVPGYVASRYLDLVARDENARQ